MASRCKAMRGLRQELIRALFLLGLLPGLLWPGVVRAHGGGTPQVTDEPAGPYRIFVWVNPEPWRAGAVAHITVAITTVDDAGQTTPVTDAAVVIRLIAENRPAQALHWEASPISTGAGFYEADGELLVDGLWNVEVIVTGNAGAGAIAFTNPAQPANSINWFILIGGVMALLAVIGFLGTRRRPGATTVPARNSTPSSVRE